jgi:hypothetical protein
VPSKLDRNGYTLANRERPLSICTLNRHKPKTKIVHSELRAIWKLRHGEPGGPEVGFEEVSSDGSRETRLFVSSVIE